MPVLLSVKEDFPALLGDHIYLDSAATTHKPQSVIDAISTFYAQEYGTVHRAVYRAVREATDAYEGVREQVATFIGAKSSEEIVFTRGTTASLNLVARSFGKAFMKPGDAVIISETEHHANIVPWQMLCAERGVQLRIIPVNDAGELVLEEYHNLLDEKVKIVSVAHVSNALGTLHPLAKIIEAAHDVGAYVCVDGAQAIAHMPIDLRTLGADFYAFSGHKMYGPTGVGVLYGRQELLEKMPPVEGGGDMIEQVTLEKSTYQKAPLKFEAGTPMIAQVIGLGAAITYLQQADPILFAGQQELLHRLTYQLENMPGLRLIGTAQEKGPILSFVAQGVHPLDLATMLDCQKVAIRSGHQCSQPTMDRFDVRAVCRVSLGIYNTASDIDRFTRILEATLDLLK